MLKSRRADSDNFEEIFTGDIPLFDLRAPVEFHQGAFPSAINLPLMSDLERAKVGTCYKQQGQAAAIKLGHKLVSGESREQRMAQWRSFIAQNPEGYGYCFRGGLRSKTVQQWLAAEGLDYPLIKGGYKAMRRFLIDTLDQLSRSFNFIVVGGRTGTRKTDLILEFPNAIDLEGRANHRGSSFGRRVGGQPTVINFENNLAIDLLKLKTYYATLLIEDEGVTIGSCSVPESLRIQIQTAPIYLVEATIAERVENILQDYVIGLAHEYLTDDPLKGWNNYCDSMFSSLERIKKRLGGERFKQLYQLMDEAFNREIEAANFDLHRHWIQVLLVDYYDPMYDFQLEKKQDRIVESGSWETIKQLLAMKTINQL